MNNKVLALDFDGLICDGLNECILVSWNGYHDKDLDAFSKQGLESIPVQFAKNFEHCRNFAQHLGHFVVPFIFQKDTITSQNKFDALYQLIDPNVVDDFIKKVTTYRHWVRRENENEWLKHHVLYPGMKTFLTNIQQPVYIVTAKDSESVLKILSIAGINFDENQIFGEQKIKIEAFRQIAHLEGIDNQELYFFDDNILNVLAAQKAGYSAYWATWGYNASDHLHIARKNAVPSLSLPDFLENQWQTNSKSSVK